MIIVKNSEWSRRFLLKWWGSARERLAGWDQHVFTRLYVDHCHSCTSEGNSRSNVHNMNSTKSYDDSRDDLHTDSHIALLTPHILNTHRPATLNQQADHAILHMIGSVFKHRTKVFQRGLSNLCSALHRSQESSQYIQPDEYRLVKEEEVNLTTLMGELPTQLGLSRQVLQDIEEEVLLSRPKECNALLRDMQLYEERMKDDYDLEMISSEEEDDDNEFLLESDTSCVENAQYCMSIVQQFKSRLDVIMKLGNPRQGHDKAEVLLCLLRMFEILDQSINVVTRRWGEHRGVEGEGGTTQWKLPASQVSQLCQWVVDVCFEICVDNEDILTLHAILSRVEPHIALLNLIHSHDDDDDSGDGDDNKQRSRHKGHILYYAFKRHHFLAGIEQLTGNTHRDNNGNQDSIADSTTPLLIHHLEIATDLWLEMHQVGMYGTSQDTMAAISEGSSVMDALSVQYCMQGVYEPGLRVGRKSLKILSQYWMLDRKEEDNDDGGNGYDGTDRVPTSVYLDLLDKHFNLAICAIEAQAAMETENLLGKVATAGVTGVDELSIYHFQQVLQILDFLCGSEKNERKENRVLLSSDGEVAKEICMEKRKQVLVYLPNTLFASNGPVEAKQGSEQGEVKITKKKVMRKRRRQDMV